MRYLTWPYDVAPLEPMEQETVDGVTLASKAAGGIQASSLLEASKEAYRVKVSLEQDADEIETFRAFLRHVRGRLNPFWVVEPRPASTDGYYHQDVLVGWGDASATAFHFPFYGTPTGSLLVDGVEATQTNLGAANQLTDAQASPGTGLTGLVVVNGSAAITASRLKSYHGQESVLVTPTGALTNYGVRTTNTAASPGDELTAIGWASGALTSLKVRLQWVDGGGSPVGNDDSTGTTATAAGWTGVSVTATAPASTAAVQVYVYQVTSLNEKFWVDCIGLCPGPYSDWWLPSVAPQVIEFSSAPGSAAKITASTTQQAKAMRRCRFVGKSYKRLIDAVGNERYQGIDLEESLP